MSDSSFNWEGPSFLRPDRKEPYLALQQVTIFVRDQDRSKKFYLDQLGFTLAYETSLESGDQWFAVSPPDGTAILALVTAKPDSDDYKLIGGQSQVVFLAEDIDATFRAWSERGVHFHHEPQVPRWGGMFTSFEDVDGNSFGLVGFDDATRHLARQRRAFAEKLESDRRAAQEIEIAKQFQTRLFPQTLPPLRTLDYAGVCIQAREVGGDYYDFLDLGRDRLGLVVGDISGKGIAAALLMANLQANLRSQIVTARDQPQRFLRSVNQLFFENTTDNAYATLFFAEYDDRARRLRYANCGHLSALLLHNDNSLERLDSTGTVLGLFKEWDCSIKESQLSSGDILALYTDGITESLNADGEEFGEERLVESVRRNRQLSASALLATILDEVKQFSALEQHDDITLIVAKCGENESINSQIPDRFE
jgi:serine phosphatase RsbU (regulator of sigma subunit)/catechol 2,3-dioxygenase-like lactoylglutathione lyase family enzyme